MAFPIPSHLPRRKEPQDVSTKILTKISEATAKSLDAQLASSWVAELDDTITQTKRRIHERMSEDLPALERQMSAAKSIQERLDSLTSNVDLLSSSLSDPESGLIPTLITALTQHASLSQETSDADVKYNALSHLLRCRGDFYNLSQLTHNGKLPQAVGACRDLDRLLGESPSPLGQSAIMLDLKRNCAAMQARTEEQLNDAYTRSIQVSASEIIICPSIQVRQSETILSLASILSALSVASLTAQLTSLRRDLSALYIEHLMKQPVAVVVTSVKDVTGTLEHKLTMFPSPPDSASPTSRLENLSVVLTFLNTHLFPYLPEAELTAFPYSLCKPIKTAVLTHLLVPSLPSSIGKLPNFLNLTRQAVAFEDEYIGLILGDHSGDRDVKAWVSTVGSHYERKRRVEILESARITILHPEDESRTFHVDLTITSEPESTAAPTVPEPPRKAQPQAIEEESEVAWGFEDGPVHNDDTSAGEENGWGFDDELDPEPETEAQPEPPLEPASNGTEAEEYSGDAWGWNDDESSPAGSSTTAADDSPWDDGWNDPPEEKGSPHGTDASAKPAKRLEKFTSKYRMDVDSSPLKSPPLIAPPPPTPVISVAPKQYAPPTVIKESYVVSGRTKELIRLVEDVLAEGAELASSGILSAYYASSGSRAGALILQAAPLTLELYRALYPVSASVELTSSSRRSIRFSNDCLYIGSEIDRIVRNLKGAMCSAKDKLVECKEAMNVLGDSWFEETIGRQNVCTNELLDKAEGFVDTMDQDRFDECEDAVNKTLQRIRQFAQQLKTNLNKSKYYLAIGSAVDAALSRILTDMLALPDITAVESHRLSELCRILNALEGLFVENPDQPSFVVSYVPSWLKFSYLSELLEASIADISYLFEEGALVDFELEELVKLVRALFADTPLRTNTINKLLQGHPVHS
ncbi:hypothetical protein BKA93DRAFT_723614 [Sparassis latifolia]|uniref:ZW10 C-terminal helical domain-containing protein n=1 Tax=Sparassis crispa TaxID=139825 RepID=A0A401H578_9APHY|nr:hypothetical protein SCP_1602600 [Sparassis crispa]GBE89597.1 hypothetical protein SCP_1602600 [Sparassis crispa]